MSCRDGTKCFARWPPNNETHRPSCHSSKPVDSHLFNPLHFSEHMASATNEPTALPSTFAEKAVEVIRSKTDVVPLVAIILGSGMGEVAKVIENPVVVNYKELPGFAVSTVHGHAGNFILGSLRGIPVCCMQGRIHLYEGGEGVRKVLVPIYTMKLLGCKYFLATTAVGSLRQEAGPGAIVCITDHINMQGVNPLVGPNDDRMGPRFPSMMDAYSPTLRKVMHDCADKHGITIHDGVYLSTTGPSFETPAEIRAFKVLGADVVGMSLVPEVIVARHCGLYCCALSIVVNLASGMSAEHITHEDTLKYADEASANVSKLCLDYVEKISTLTEL